MNKEILIKQIEKKNYLKNIIDFFNKKTTYFLNSNDVSSEIEIVLCFENYSHNVTVTQEDIKSRNVTKIENKNDIINSISILDDYFKHKKNSECYEKYNELKNCFLGNLSNKHFDSDCQKYEYLRSRKKDDDFDSDDFDEENKNIIIDPLGIYISEEIYNKHDRNLYKCKILLFCNKIINVAIHERVDITALFEVVLVHELAHAFHHIGLDSKANINTNFHTFDKYIKEGFAEYMVVQYFQFLRTNFSKKSSELETAFDSVKHSTGPYAKHQDWLDKAYSILAITTANNHFRYLKPSAKIHCRDYEIEIDRIITHSHV